MTDLRKRKILDVRSLKEPTRPLRQLLQESTAESKKEIVTSGRRAKDQRVFHAAQ